MIRRNRVAIRFLHGYFVLIINLEVGGQPWGVPQNEVGVIPCSDQVEEGAFFGGGFVKVRKS